MTPHPRTSIRPPAFAAALVLVLALGLGACSDDDGGDDDAGSATTTTEATTTTSEETTTSAAEAVEGDAVSIVDFDFAPKDLAVAAGTAVTFTNDDSTTHTATADDGSFDTGDLGSGDSGEVTLDQPGTFTYHCAIHSNMTGTVVVE